MIAHPTIAGLKRLAMRRTPWRWEDPEDGWRSHGKRWIVEQPRLRLEDKMAAWRLLTGGGE